MKHICWLMFLILTSVSCVSKQGVEVISGPGKLQVTSVNLTQAFDGILLGNIINKNITLKNTGGLPLTKLIFSQFPEKGSQFSYQEGRTPGDPGSCGNGADLKPGETCTFGVTFAPSVEGVWSEKIEIKFNDGLDDNSVVIPLNGSAGLVANVVTVDGFEGTFGVYEIGAEVEKVVTITNKGGLEARNFAPTLIGEGEIYYKGGSYPGTGGTCNEKLRFQETCQMVFVFKPTVNKSHERQISFSYTAPVNENILVISLTAVSADIEARLFFLGGPKGTFHDYEKTTIGAPTKHTFTLVNTGYVTASNLNLNINAPFSISSTDCEETLEVSSLCSVEVEFAPLSKADFSENLTVSYYNGNSSQAIIASVVGKGINPGRLEYFDLVSLPNYDFGDGPVNGSKKKYFLIRNTGDVKITNMSIGSLSAPLSHSHACANVLLPGQNCYLEAYFKPTTLGAITPQDLVISFHSGVSNTSHAFSISGTGAALGFLKFTPSPNTHEFGSVFLGSSSSSKIITLTNTGLGDAINVTASLISPFFYVGGSQPGTAGTCPSSSGFTLAAGTSCTFEIVFTPTSTSFTFFDFQMNYSNVSYAEEPIKFRLTGTGMTPAQLVFDGTNPEIIGNFSRNAGYNKFFTLRNTGTIEATITNVALTNGTSISFAGDGTYPGIEVGGSGAFCTTTLGAGQSCIFGLKMYSSLYGNQIDTLTIDYNTGTGPSTVAKDFHANFADIGLLQADVELNIPNAVIGGSPRTAILTLNNLGSGPVNSLVWSGFGNGFTFDAADTTCLSVIPANSSCNFSVQYTASNPVGSKTRLIRFDYDTGMDPDYIQSTMKSRSMSPAKLTINNGPLYDYGLVVINTLATRSFLIVNSGSAPALNVTLSGLALPFAGPNPPCGGTIQGNSSCSINVTFTPTTAGLVSNDTIEITYNTGVVNDIITRDIMGTGETPPSNHGGWSEIYATGNTVDVSNNSLGDKIVRLKWNDMSPTAGTITGYNVYRTTTSGDYDWDNPVATNISTSSKSFGDTTASQGNIYYYMVRPIIYGFPSRVLQPYGEVRVIAPPDNMALGHRWMINQDMCGKIGKSADKNNFHRCLYTGVGHKSGYYDIGTDLVVDRFELGADLTSKPGQFPITSLSQSGAKQACNLQKNITIAGAGTTFTKQVLSRKQWMAMASWPAGLTDTQITNKEGALTSSNECNGSGASLEETGKNSSCVSRYGMENAAGNAWEWVSDRVLDGKGMTEPSYKLDQSNTDFDGIEFKAINTGLLENRTCFNKIIGIPRPLNESANCPADTLTVMNEPTITFHNDYYWETGDTGARIPVVGGSFTSTTYSGIYSLAWVDFNFNSASTRCGFGVP